MSDLIDRQAAIEAIRKLPNAGVHWLVSAEAVFDALLKLPSAQPEQRCMSLHEPYGKEANCDDNRFELIQKYRDKLIDGTNIESSENEMAVLGNLLFRFWQMGWLDKLEKDGD